MQAGNPPAVRPQNLMRDLARLWSLLESCWARDPLSRPHAYILSSHLADTLENYDSDTTVDPYTSTAIDPVLLSVMSTGMVDSHNQDPTHYAATPNPLSYVPPWPAIPTPPLHFTPPPPTWTNHMSGVPYVSAERHTGALHKGAMATCEFWCVAYPEVDSGNSSLPLSQPINHTQKKYETPC
jgi:hypothetical protein